MPVRTICSIGHSNHPAAVFVAMLQSFGIRHLADIRSFPGSRRYPQYNRHSLMAALADAGIHYTHLPGLGGRRNLLHDVTNTTRGQGHFHSYALYMKTDEFSAALQELETLAGQCPTAYMCAEADWQHCHRSMVSECLSANDWKVLHIRSLGTAIQHPATEQGRLF